LDKREAEREVSDLCRKLELTNEQCYQILDSIPKICPCLERKGKARAKSAYQVFMGECIKGKAKDGAAVPQRMKECASEWKTEKEKRR